MKTLCVAAVIFGGVLALCPPAFSQLVAAEPDLAASVATARKQYTAAFVSHPQLYSGPEYLDYAKRYHARTGHQFYASPEKQTGRIYYNDYHFEAVPMQYDVVLDQLVISQPGSPLMLRLINEKVRAFSIDNHQFIRLVGDSSASSVIRTGYYEVLLDSKIQLLAQRTKYLQERLNQTFVDVEFVTTDKLFIKKEGLYYPVSKKASVVRLFSDHNKEIQRYMQEHKLRFNKRLREAAIVQLASYYCSLPIR